MHSYLHVNIAMVLCVVVVCGDINRDLLLVLRDVFGSDVIKFK